MGAAAAAFTLMAVIAVIANYTTAFLCSLLAIPLGLFISVCSLLMPVARKLYLLALSMLCILPAIPLGAAIGLWTGTFIKSDIRWLFQSRQYKTAVVQQSVYGDGTFRHVEWDTWGLFSESTTEYLVYDPTDSLPRRLDAPGRFKGIPCAVPKIERMEAHWYVVLFYTDQAWNYCGQ